MALQLSASIYRIGPNDLNTARGIPAIQGITMSFPTDQIRIEAAKPGETAIGITMNTIIKLLPEGLNQAEKSFYTPTATATVITAANA